MDRREAFNAMVQHQAPERVLVDYGKHIGSFHRNAYELLKAQVGIEAETRILDRMAQNVVLDERVCQRLGIDFRWVAPHWVGVRDVEIDGEPGYVDMWQTPHKWTDVGQYYAIHAQPLGQETLTEEDIEAFAWPDPHQPAMFEGLRQGAQRWYETSDYVVGADGIKAGILQTASQIRGYDKLFLDFGLNPAIAHTLLDKISEIIDEMYRQYMRAVGPYVQVVVITDDQGTQTSLMISPKMFREFIKPRLRSLIAAIKGEAPHVKVLMHCDGAIARIVDDLIEIGVDILNPIQTVVTGFEDTYALKEEFGDRVCFHGGIDVQQVLPKASVADVRHEVARRIHDLGRDGGYILAPCHNINVDIPVENVVALFEAAQEFGHYPLKGKTDV
ncbi:MAG: uroporphyrinogen decarboxylase family protein [Anaerolineae bacterium]|jgi:uroporphyrinogen decarboxylase